jgi:hypothetical protein
MISPRLQAGLDHLARLMQAEAEPWWIIGSTALVLTGLDNLEPDDIDVVASGDCLRRALASAGVDEMAPRPHPRFHSSPYQRIEWQGAAPIELMGDLRVKTPVEAVRIVFESRISVLAGRSELFIPSAAEQIALLNLFGREKDLAKAARLRAFVMPRTGF